MNSPYPAPAAPRRNWARRLVNVLVALVVVAVAGAAFVFSYAGVHAIALFGGMSTQLARYYPGLFDAVLVIACVAAVMLRDGRWWARLWAWVVVIVLLAAIGTTDVLHAMNYTLRHRVTEGLVAAAPIVAVLLAFSLLITLLRQSRAQGPQPARPAPLDVPALPAAISASPIALPAAPAAPLEQHRVPAADLAATAPAAVVAAEPAFLPEPAPAPEPEEAPAPGAALTREEPARPGDLDVPLGAAPHEVHPAPPAHSATEPNEVISPVAPAAPADLADEADSAEPAGLAERGPAEEDGPAPPTAPVPTASPAPAAETAAVRTQSIRYAGSGVPPATQDAPAAERGASDDDYWDSEEAGQFAGLVYPAREDDTDLADTAAASDDDDDEVSDAEADQSARRVPPELDDDAPPFATAPFASVPRLNRVRSMPAPPTDEDE